MVPVLPDEHTQHNEGEARQMPRPDQDRSLEAVSDDFRRVLSTDGTLDGDEDNPDLIHRQILRIKDEALRQGFLYNGLLPAFIGGVEHDVAFDYESGTILKFTKPGKAAMDCYRLLRVDCGLPFVFRCANLSRPSGTRARL